MLYQVTFFYFKLKCINLCLNFVVYKKELLNLKVKYINHIQLNKERIMNFIYGLILSFIGLFSLSIALYINQVNSSNYIGFITLIYFLTMFSCLVIVMINSISYSKSIFYKLRQYLIHLRHNILATIINIIYFLTVITYFKYLFVLLLDNISIEYILHINLYVIIISMFPTLYLFHSLSQIYISLTRKVKPNFSILNLKYSPLQVLFMVLSFEFFHIYGKPFIIETFNWTCDNISTKLKVVLEYYINQYRPDRGNIYYKHLISIGTNKVLFINKFNFNVIKISHLNVNSSFNIASTNVGNSIIIYLAKSALNFKLPYNNLIPIEANYGISIENIFKLKNIFNSLSFESKINLKWAVDNLSNNYKYKLIVYYNLLSKQGKYEFLKNQLLRFEGNTNSYLTNNHKLASCNNIGIKYINNIVKCIDDVYMNEILKYTSYNYTSDIAKCVSKNLNPLYVTADKNLNPLSATADKNELYWLFNNPNRDIDNLVRYTNNNFEVRMNNQPSLPNMNTYSNLLPIAGESSAISIENSNPLNLVRKKLENLLKSGLVKFTAGDLKFKEQIVFFSFLREMDQGRYNAVASEGGLPRWYNCTISQSLLDLLINTEWNKSELYNFQVETANKLNQLRELDSNPNSARIMKNALNNSENYLILRFLKQYHIKLFYAVTYHGVSFDNAGYWPPGVVSKLLIFKLGTCQLTPFSLDNLEHDLFFKSKTNIEMEFTSESLESLDKGKNIDISSNSEYRNTPLVESSMSLINSETISNINVTSNINPNHLSNYNYSSNISLANNMNYDYQSNNNYESNNNYQLTRNLASSIDYDSSMKILIRSKLLNQWNSNMGNNRWELVFSNDYPENSILNFDERRFIIEYINSRPESGYYIINQEGIAKVFYSWFGSSPTAVTTTPDFISFFN